MSALLSPPPPVRTRFKVPGEGSYELCADLPPPPPPPYSPPPSTPPPPSKPSTSTSTTPPPPSQPSATVGPLGLPKVTKLTFAPHGTLHPTLSTSTLQDGTPTASPRTPSQPGVASMFSFRKLTGLGSSISAKFGGGDLEDVGVSPRQEEGVKAPPRVAARGGGVLGYNVSEGVMLVDMRGEGELNMTVQVRGGVSAQDLRGSSEGLRLLVGCANGEVVYFGDVVMEGRKKGGVVFNKDGVVNSTRVVGIGWVSGSLYRFWTVHLDGGVVVYDVRFRGVVKQNNGEEGGEERNGWGVVKRVGMHDVVVMRGGKGRRSNPVTIWQIGKGGVTACEFSPGEGKMLAITGRDGYLRVVDFGREVPLVAFRSYFGGLLCVSWSPDGKYVATGGEDDLVSIWSPVEERLVARLEGHTSWVSAVAWDESMSARGRYRIGSAGQDAKLLLWDFALDVLHHPSPQHRGEGVVRLRSYVRESNGGVGVERKASKLSRLRGHTNNAQQENEDVNVPVATPLVVGALGRAQVPVVEPVVAHVAHGEPLTDVWFQQGGVFTADCAGGVKMWSRPAAHAVPALCLEATEAVQTPVNTVGTPPSTTPPKRGIASDLD